MQVIHFTCGLIYVLCGMLFLYYIIQLIHCLVINKVWDKMIDACYCFDYDRIVNNEYDNHMLRSVCCKERMNKSYDDLRIWRQKDLLTTQEYNLLKPYFENRLINPEGCD